MKRNRKIINGKNVAVDYWGRQLEYQQKGKKGVYKFEFRIEGSRASYLSKKECQELAEKAMRWWHGIKFDEPLIQEEKENLGIDVPVLFNTQGHYDSRGLTSNANANRILLQTKWGMNHYVVLHEVTHVIMLRDECLRGLACHGAEFVKIMLMLWGRFINEKAKFQIRENNGFPAHLMVGVPTYGLYLKWAREHGLKVSGNKLKDGTDIRPINRVCRHVKHNSSYVSGINHNCSGH